MNINTNPFRDMSVGVLATPSANRAMVGALQVTNFELSSIIHRTPGTFSKHEESKKKLREQIT